MYAVKPWGNAALVGATIATYAIGIGMRWRETIATVIEQRASPMYELQERRRCVMTQHSVRLLTDLGCTGHRLRAVLRPARGWRLLALHDLTEQRSSSTFAGCAPDETVWHCTEGALLRMLRSEFVRFGGCVAWGTTAYDAYADVDGSGMWCLRMDYGTTPQLEAIVTTARNTALAQSLLVNDAVGGGAVVLSTYTGVATMSPDTRARLLGDKADVALLAGGGVAMHCWSAEDNDVCAWRLICQPSPHEQPQTTPHNEAAQLRLRTQLCDVLRDADVRVRELVSSSSELTSSLCVLPASVPAIRATAAHSRASVLGDGLLPVDAFEWRGDRCRCAVEDAAALCRAFYSVKYHRGDARVLLRDLEQECIAKRTSLLRRDLRDTENFLATRLSLRDVSSASVDDDVHAATRMLEHRAE